MTSSPQHHDATTTPTETIRLLLVDDHTILRQGLRQLLETAPGISVCAEANDGDEAIVQALQHRPDIILMDVNLPKVNGYESSRAILTAWPQARIVVLTNQDDGQVVKKFMGLEVKGFLLKDIELTVLLGHLHRVMAGDKIPLGPDLQSKVDLMKAQAAKRSVVDLTEREKEVLQALAKGYSNRQLADLLVVSPKTVHNHLYNIYSKIGVGSRAEAIVWALDPQNMT